MPTILYNDNRLPADYGVAYRRAALKEAGDSTTLVLPSMQNAQQVVTAMQMLCHIKQAAGYPPAKGSAQEPIFDAFVNAGMLGSDGRASSDLLNRLNKPDELRVEVICQVNKGHYATLVLAKDGLAYIDPKGKACPKDKVSFNTQKGPKSAPFSEIIKNLWGDFFGIFRAIEEDESKKGENNKGERVRQRANAVLQKACKLHDFKQQDSDNNHSSLDWCLTNLNALKEKGITAQPEVLKKAKKIERSHIVEVLNKIEDPKNPGQNLDLTYENKSKDQPLLDERAKEYNEMRTRTETTCHSARQLWRSHQASGNSNYNDLPTWAKVAIKSEPTFADEIKKPNAYPAITHASGITNHIKLESGKMVAHSTGGSAPTYKARFLAMAQDLASTRSQAEVSSASPIVVLIETIEPKDERETCKEAFKEYFESICGPGSVVFEEPDPTPDEEDGDCISARPMSGCG